MYKHIFELFNKDFERIGGAEPLSETTEQPELKYAGSCRIVYIGYCDETDKIRTCTRYGDYVIRDNDTKRLILKEDCPTDITFKSYTFGELIRWIGDSCQEYEEAKKKQEKEIIREYKKCLADFDYFKAKYVKYNKIIK